MLSIFSVDLWIQYWFVMTWWKLFGRVIWWLLLRKRKPQENLFMVNRFQFSLCSLFDWGIHYLCFHRYGLNWDQLVIIRSKLDTAHKIWLSLNDIFMQNIIRCTGEFGALTWITQGCLLKKWALHFLSMITIYVIISMEMTIRFHSN